MTRKQFEKRTRTMIARAAANMREMIPHVLNSGAVDLEDWGDNYALPKYALEAMLKRTAIDYGPLDNRESRNLRRTLDRVV